MVTEMDNHMCDKCLEDEILDLKSALFIAQAKYDTEVTLYQKTQEKLSKTSIQLGRAMEVITETIDKQQLRVEEQYILDGRRVTYIPKEGEIKSKDLKAQVEMLEAQLKRVMKDNLSDNMKRCNNCSNRTYKLGCPHDDDCIEYDPRT